MHMKKKRVLGVITARGGSKGLPGKNTKLLGGKPLVAWTIQAAQKSKHIDDLIISTDDAEIARISAEWGGSVPFMRPSELALDATPHLPVMQHAVTEMERRTAVMYDYAVILQPTSPFRKPEYIDETFETLMREGADSAVTVYEIDGSDHPMKIKKIEGSRLLAYTLEEPEGARRQDLPRAYKRSSDVYAMTRACLMEKGQLYGDHVAAHVVPSRWVIDIDDELDWLVAEELARQWSDLPQRLT